MEDVELGEGVGVDLITTTILLPSPLEFNLPQAVFLFISELGLLSSINSINTSLKLIKDDYQSISVKRSLINTKDITILLSIIPSTLLINLPIIKSASATASTRKKVLDTLARLSLEPSLTLPIMRRFRPLSVHFWGKWLEMLGIDTTTGEFSYRNHNENIDDAVVEQERRQVETVYRAMVSVLSIFENCFP